jgi:hypothetical protein
VRQQVVVPGKDTTVEKPHGGVQMFGTMAGGLLVGPCLGAWDLAWQSPTAGLAMLGSLFTVLLMGAALMVYGSHLRREFAERSIRVHASGQPGTPNRQGKIGAA